MKYTQGRIVNWKNKKNEQIIWMITDKPSIGVVIHSDGLLKIGTTSDLSKYDVNPYIGNININSN